MDTYGSSFKLFFQMWQVAMLQTGKGSLHGFTYAEERCFCISIHNTGSRESVRLCALCVLAFLLQCVTYHTMQCTLPLRPIWATLPMSSRMDPLPV